MMKNKKYEYKKKNTILLVKRFSAFLAISAFAQSIKPLVCNSVCKANELILKQMLLKLSELILCKNNSKGCYRDKSNHRLYLSQVDQRCYGFYIEAFLKN